MEIVRAGIQLSRSSVQRILREKEPAAPTVAKPAAVENESRVTPHHILRPEKPNRTWHLDLMYPSGEPHPTPRDFRQVNCGEAREACQDWGAVPSRGLGAGFQ